MKKLFPIEAFLFLAIFDRHLSFNIGFNLKFHYVFIIVYALFSLRKDSIRIFSQKIIFIYTLLIFMIISGVWADPNFGVTFRISFILIWIIQIFVFDNLTRDIKNYKILFMNIGRIGLINAGIGIIEIFSQKVFDYKFPVPIGSEFTHPDLYQRSFGFMFEPNYYGLLQIMFFIFYIKSGKINLLGVIAFASSIILAGNKVTLLAFTIILMLVFFSNEVIKISLRKKLLYFLITATVIPLLAMQFAQKILVERIEVFYVYFSNYGLSHAFKFYDRFAYIAALFKGFLESPVIGNGLNSSLIIHNEISWRNIPIDKIEPNMTVQSGLFRLLYEQGLVGFTLLIVIIRKMFKKVNRNLFTRMLSVTLALHFIFYDLWNAFYSLPILIFTFVLPFDKINQIEETNSHN